MRKGFVVAIISFLVVVAFSFYSLYDEQTISQSSLLAIALALINYNAVILGISSEYKKARSLMEMGFMEKTFVIIGVYFQAFFVSSALMVKAFE